MSTPENPSNPPRPREGGAHNDDGQRNDGTTNGTRPGTNDSVIEKEMARRTRRAFLTGLLAAGAGFGGWRWLKTRDEADGIPWPLRKMLAFNEKVSGKIFNPNRHIAERRADEITPGGPRVNGMIGLQYPQDLESWRLHIEGPNLALTLDEIKTLPPVTQITPLNCIEGWTTVAKWTGARLVDFADRFHPAGRSKAYVGLQTPSGQYYVGLDAASAFHPQTLLCYAINDQPLTSSHGAPLRLLVPTKYGIKNLKRIGTIHFTDTRPADYWAERGYDWFAGF
jgi:hypothetical protein